TTTPPPPRSTLFPYTTLFRSLRDYVRKNGFRSVVIALSGGIDSALSTAIACDAIGPENVYCYSMPSKYSSEHSKGDAAEMARRRSEEHTSELQSRFDLVCRLL